MASGTERRRFALIVAAIVALDLVTKLIAVRALPPYLGVRLMGDAFQLRLVYNSGAAFGLNVGDRSRWVFMALSVAAITVLISMLRATRPGDWPIPRRRCACSSRRTRQKPGRWPLSCTS